MTEPRKLIFLGDTFVTVQLEDDALDALARFHNEHSAELNELTKPFGFEWRDVINPKFERVIWDTELVYASSSKRLDSDG